MTKKILSMALAIAMVMALSVTAFAANITVADAVVNETYNIYKIFDATNNGTAVSYTMVEGDQFQEFIKAYQYNGKTIFTLTPSATDPNVNVVTVDPSFTGDAAAKDFAEKLYAVIDSYTAAKDPITAVEGQAVTFTDLDKGYYFVTTSLGALCALDSQLDTITIVEKNTLPNLEKEVQEDDENGTWGEYATADYGQVVNFRLTVTVGKGNDKAYTINDVLPTGMTYVGVTAQNGLTATPANDNKSVKFVIDAETIKGLNDTGAKTFVIEYQAMVDGGVAVNSEMENVATLTYSGQTYTAEASVYTHSVPVYKYTGTEEVMTDLPGATFALYKMDDNTKMYYVLGADNKVTWTEDLEAATKYTSDAKGQLVFNGVDAGEYFLEETEAPDGYNLLTTPKAVTVVDKTGAVQTDVLNQSGTELPSTGGIGTTIFYALGAVMVIGAGVLLVAKKRMSVEG